MHVILWMLIPVIKTLICLLSVFNQGDEGKSWYIILKGSVNVVIYGKVCTVGTESNKPLMGQRTDPDIGHCLPEFIDEHKS